MPKIKTYQIAYFGNPIEKWFNTRARIYLYGTRGRQVGEIRFCPWEGSKPFDWDFKDSSGRIYMYLPMRELPGIMDILRNEKPLWISFHQPSTWDMASLNYACECWAVLTSWHEPVGEEEGIPSRYQKSQITLSR